MILEYLPCSPGHPSFSCSVTLSCNNLLVPESRPPKLFPKDQIPQQATQWVRKKDTKFVSRDLFNRLSKDKKALLYGLVNYFQFGILSAKNRALACMGSCQGSRCFRAGNIYNGKLLSIRNF